MKTVFAGYSMLLRRAGFRKAWDSRAGGIRVAEWHREEPDGRLLACQIWEDGYHRISHSWCGCSDTLPTDFRTEEGFAAAVKREATRIDGSYRRPDAHYVPAAREFLLAKRAALLAAQKATGR